MASLNSVKERVEESSAFVEWLTEVLTSKNPVKRLLLVDAILFVFFDPLYFPKFVQLVTGRQISEWYSWVFWPLFGFIFVVAVITAVRVKRREAAFASPPTEHSIIKGLFSFEKEDAEAFRRLQREDSLRGCLTVLTNNDFRFGILSGESGCGKTSYLRAGLWPRLMAQGYRCLYVKFTDVDPLDSIRAALVEQFNLSATELDGADLVTMLEAVPQGNPRPIILLLDQFEQFFVHRKRKQLRKPFVEALATWYRKQPPLPSRILISLRQDFVGNLFELQKAMSYSLGPQQTFRLEKFEPKEAVRIFRVIAESENVSFDETFLEEFAEQELASRDDGLVSPVDIQLIAWMISDQSEQSNRAFNRSSFQKIGGVEGLLETFLNDALSARETESRRQAAIKVLLALIDLDGNARAGVLTLDALNKKLAGTASNADVKEAVGWLTRPDVRLVNQIDNGYELAHERLIPALRRVAGRSLSVLDQANLLLDRRVNEWLGNNRSRRYLLRWREWRLIEKQRPYLVWGQKKAPKLDLLKKSKIRWQLLLAAVIAPVVLASVGLVSYALWRRSEAGQIYSIKNDLLSFSEGVTGENALNDVVKSFVLSDMPAQAFQVVDRIKDPNTKARLLDAISVATIEANQSQEAVDRALQITSRIAELSDNNKALSHLSLTLARVGTSKQSGELVERALEVAASIKIVEKEFGSKTTRNETLTEVVADVAKMSTLKHSTLLLDRAFETAKTIDDPVYRAKALELISDAMGTLDFEQREELFDQVSSTTEELEPSASQRIATFNHFISAVAKRNDQIAAKLLDRAAVFAATRQDNLEFKVSALTVLAVANTTKDPKPSSHLLNQAIENANGAPNPGNRALALKAVADALMTTDPRHAIELLKAAGQAAAQMKFEGSVDGAKADLNVSKEVARIATAHQSLEFFTKAIELVRNDSDKLEIARVVTGYTSSYEPKTMSQATPEILKRTIQLAKDITDPLDKAQALILLATFLGPTDSDQAASLLNKVFEVFQIVQKKPVDPSVLEDHAFSLSEALETIDLRKFPDIAQQAVTFANGLEKPYPKLSILIALTDATAKFDVQRSVELFDQALDALRGNNKQEEADTITRIAIAMSRAAVAAHSVALLNKAVHLSQEISDSRSRPIALTAVAAVAVKLNDLRLAHDLALMNNDNENTVKTLAFVLKTRALIKRPALAELDDALQFSNIPFAF